jgi:hypothetical protein
MFQIGNTNMIHVLTSLCISGIYYITCVPPCSNTTLSLLRYIFYRNHTNLVNEYKFTLTIKIDVFRDKFCLHLIHYLCALSNRNIATDWTEFYCLCPYKKFCFAKQSFDKINRPCMNTIMKLCCVSSWCIFI